MLVTFDERASVGTVFASDVRLPQVGTKVPVRGGGEATLITASWIDNQTIRITLELELPKDVEAILGIDMLPDDWATITLST